MLLPLLQAFPYMEEGIKISAREKPGFERKALPFIRLKFNRSLLWSFVEPDIALLLL